MKLESRFRKAIAYGFAIILLGGFGGVLLDRLVLPYLSTLPGLRKLALLNPQAPIVITKREEIRINEGINYTETANRVKNVLASVYVHEGEFNSVRFRLLDHFSGLVLGSDGVLVAPRFELRAGQTITVLLLGQAPLAAKVLAADELTQTVFLTVAARDLPVARPAPSRETRAGERLLVLWSEGSPQNPKILPVVQSAEASPKAKIDEFYSFRELNAFLEIGAANLTREARGGVVVTRDASVVGFVTAVGENSAVLRSDDLKKVTDNFFDDQKISWPRLLVTYRILDSALVELFGLPKKYGILLKTGPPPVQANDFIYAVDGRELSAQEGFQDIVLQKKPGQKVKFKLIREGQEVEVEYTLQ